METTTASACGKLILFGEHAVVYGKPAIAVPLKELKLNVEVRENKESDNGLEIESRNFEDIELLKKGTIRILEKLGIKNNNIKLRISSDIPAAAGLGSSAAFAVAATRAIAEFFGKNLDSKELIEASYAAETVFHGKPSGIDNAVVAYEKPVYFVKDKKPEFIEFVSPLTLLVVNTGIRSKTADVVNEVRERYEKNKEEYEAIFHDIENVVEKAGQSLEKGFISLAGKLMDENQQALERLGVSTKEINELIQDCKTLGCLGAKISGAGKGGNVIVLVDETSKEEVKKALEEKGKSVMMMEVN